MDKKDEAGPIEDLLRRAKVLDSRTAQLLMREAYEQHYGLFDHEHLSEMRPLSLVAMHPKENTSAYSALYRMAYKYQQYDILKKWGLNYQEFLSLPREQVELIFKISGEQLSIEKPIIEAAANEMKKLQQQATK
jgi:hypothetical protein